MGQSMIREEMVAAFNEWMRRYTDEPQRFEREFQSVSQFLAETATDSVPSYGQECAAYMLKITSELAAM